MCISVLYFTPQYSFGIYRVFLAWDLLLLLFWNVILYGVRFSRIFLSYKNIRIILPNGETKHVENREKKIQKVK